MGRIIIDYDDTISDNEAIHRVATVVADGKISESNNVPHYCWATSFSDGVVVWTRRKKSYQKSDSFCVTRGKQRNDSVT